MASTPAKRRPGRPKKEVPPAAGAAAAAGVPSSPVASLAPPPALLDLTLSSSPALTDISSDVELLSPPPKKSGSNAATAASGMSTPAANKLHPFFSMLGKKPSPPPATPVAAPLSSLAALPSVDERKEGSDGGATQLSPSGAAAPAPGVGSPPSPALQPSRCALDVLYAGKPKDPFFMTPSEKVKVRVEKREHQFTADIAAESLERKRLLASFADSGKKIHPFLQPRAPGCAKERSSCGTGGAVGSGVAGGNAGGKSEFASLSFAPAAEQPAFPHSFSHVPLDFENVANGPAAANPIVELEFTAPQWQRAGVRRITAEKVNPPGRISAPPRIAPLRVPELSALLAAARSSSGSSTGGSISLPPSLPIWARPPIGAAALSVDYLSAPAFRSSDVSNYLAQPRAQAFLRDVVDKLTAMTRRSNNPGGEAAAGWTLEQVQRLTRRLLIRRLHCFRAMQRDEQTAAAVRKQREASQAGTEGSTAASSSSAPSASSSSSSAALSRSDRALQRGLKAETSEHRTHSDEQVSHTFQPRPDSLWSEQYRAFRAEEMFAGNRAQRAQVREWLQSWSLRQKQHEQQQQQQQDAASSATNTASAASSAPPSSTKRRARSKYVFYSDDSDFEDASELYNPRSSAPSPPPPASAASASGELVTTLLLVGPGGVGKTSLVYACCHESDTGIIEIGSNMRRAQRDVLAKCEEATQSHRLALVATVAGSASSASTAPLQASKQAMPLLSQTNTKSTNATSAKKTNSPATSQSAKGSGKEEQTPRAKKPAFNFFDLAAQKKQQLEAAAAASAIASSAAPRGRPKRKGHADAEGDDGDDDGDGDFSLSPQPATKKAKAAAPPAAAPAAPVKVSKKSLFAMKTKANSKQAIIKGEPEELVSDDDDKDEDDSGASHSATGSTGKKRKASAGGATPTPVKSADFFGNQAAFTPAKKAKGATTSALLSTGGGGGAASSAFPFAGVASVHDPLAPVSRASSQTAILFEEADVVFPSLDRKFLPAVRALISHAKRPIILTAECINKDMEEALGISAAGATMDPTFQPSLAANGLPLIEVVRFERPSALELLPYVFLVAAVEIGFHNAECLARLPSLGEVEQLLVFHQSDVRKTLLAMQLALTSTPLTLMLGNDNLLAASSVPVAAAAGKKKRAAGLRLHGPERTSNQDLVLSGAGLLGHKEELLALFDRTVAQAHSLALTAAPPVSAKAATATATVSTEVAATALQLAQAETLFAARSQDMPLFHLNYLPSLCHALASPSSSVAVGGPAEGGRSLLSTLPLRLAALPMTAEDLYPLESVQLTPELLSIMPDGVTSDGDSSILESASVAGSAPFATADAPVASASPSAEANAMEVNAEEKAPTAQEVPELPPISVPTADALAAVPVASDAPAAIAPSSPAPAPNASESSPAVASESVSEDGHDDDKDDEDDEDDGEDDGDLDDSFRVLLAKKKPQEPHQRPKKRIVLDDDEDEDNGGDDENAGDGEEVEDLDESAAIYAAQTALKAKQREADAILQRAVNELRHKQRSELREQLVSAEESRRRSRRAVQRAGERDSSPRSSGLQLQHSVLQLLDDMSLLADCISAADVCEQPPDRGMSFCRVSSRSHSRYSPALHRGVTSASRSYVPLYLDALPSFQTEGRARLETAWADDIEEEAESGDRDLRAEEAKRLASQGIGALMPAVAGGGEKKKSHKAALAAGETLEDVPEVAWESNRDAATGIELQAAAALRRTTAWLQEALPTIASDGTQPPLSTLTTLNVPSQAFHPSWADVQNSSAPLPAATIDAPIVIDDSPPPAGSLPAASQPLFLPSAEDAGCASPLSVQVFQPVVPHCSPTYRREMSALAFRLWDNVHSVPLLFSSSAFLLDLLPFLRGVLQLALDSSHAIHVSAAAATSAADAELAASLSARDGGRSSRRSTRAMSIAQPKLSRRWQQVADCFWKTSAADTVRALQTCSWSDAKQRPLQLHIVWQASGEVEAAAAGAAEARAQGALPSVAPAALPSAAADVGMS